MTARERRDANKEEYKTVYVDGVETQIKNQGYHPSGREFYTLDEKTINDALAWWTKPDVIRDNNMRRPDDPLYDKTSIHIPQKAWEEQSGSMI